MNIGRGLLIACLGCHSRESGWRKRCRAVYSDGIVIHARNGHYGLIEIKLGGDDLIAEGAAMLNKLAKILNPDKMRMPSFKMVLTAVGDYAYRREEDDVIVCPISALKP